MIPKIIHQSYRSAEHPYPKHWQYSWMKNHPTWDYRFHTDGDNREIVRRQFPQFLEAFDRFPQGIMRADFTRFLYLYSWGGVYADLDYVCLKPFDQLVLETPKLGVPVLPDNTYYHYHNALLISEPGNPFWLRCAEQAIAYFDSSASPEVEWLAGPFRLQNAIESEKPAFVAMPMHQVTPFDWFAFVHWGKRNDAVLTHARTLKGSPIETMRRAFPQAYAITFWEHQW